MNAIRRSTKWRRSLTALPGVGAALLPVGACPVCWPAYSGILGALGLTFLLDSAYVLWTALVLLSAALLALAFRAEKRRGYGPLLLGVASVGMVVFFKFAWVLDPLVYMGVSGLVIASVWNAWPKKAEKAGACSRCAGTAG